MRGVERISTILLDEFDLCDDAVLSEAQLREAKKLKAQTEPFFKHEDPTTNDLDGALLYTRCLLCGGRLRSRKSMERGYGPGCYKKLEEGNE